MTTAESILTEGDELQHQQEETVELDLLSQSAEIQITGAASSL